ncbi:MAG TPA: class I SAM-dependent methyltransferase [Pyrinomonadaceae bacterium]|nr:class I SAM-dependent methyltransferase [Pyrinomonadaceae bacterium]
MKARESVPLQRQRATYDRLAAHYDRAIEPLERWFLARLRKRTLATLPENSRILEIGAGTGRNFPHYPRAARGVASELSFAMIEKARSKNRPPGIHLVQHSAEMLPYPDASFEAAVATLVFCSVASPRQAFAELRRVVRPGGTVSLLEHVRPAGLLGLLFDLLNIFTVALCDDHFNRRTADEARRAGLRPLRIERRGFGIVQIIVCRV